MEGQKYDNIILDYLIEAVEGFEAYGQEDVIKRLSRLLAPQGWCRHIRDAMIMRPFL